MKHILLLFSCWLAVILSVESQTYSPINPAKAYGNLFVEVQQSNLFIDSKTFADAGTKLPPQRIKTLYDSLRVLPDFSLKAFVDSFFVLPEVVTVDFRSDVNQPVEQHIARLWPVLTRHDNKANSYSSLIPLPHQYVVPGGRFREIYYWDSYFTMLGLQAQQRRFIVKSMIDNFAWLIDSLGFIPNGNRTYYLSRSQPPFFALMVGLLADEQPSIWREYLPQIQKEYDFWMTGKESVGTPNRSYKRVCKMPDGSILNRYWDDEPQPRPESYRRRCPLGP